IRRKGSRQHAAHTPSAESTPAPEDQRATRVDEAGESPQALRAMRSEVTRSRVPGISAAMTAASIGAACVEPELRVESRPRTFRSCHAKRHWTGVGRYRDIKLHERAALTLVGDELSDRGDRVWWKLKAIAV